jgi:hypothetical protein
MIQTLLDMLKSLRRKRIYLYTFYVLTLLLLGLILYAFHLDNQMLPRSFPIVYSVMMGLVVFSRHAIIDFMLIIYLSIILLR